MAAPIGNAPQKIAFILQKIMYLCKMIKSILSGLKPYEIVEYILLMVMAVAIPISWSLATYVLLLLFVFTIVKLFWSHHVGNSALNRNGRICLYLMMSFFACYLTSLTYSSDMAEGKEVVMRKLPFLVLPLIVLTSELAYLKGRRMRVLLYLFAATVVVRFVIFLCIALYGCAFVSHSLSIPKSGAFDPLHHTYLAMYVLFCLAFLYLDEMRHGKSRSRGIHITLVVVALMLCADLLFIQSRTGILGLVLLVALMWLHLVFVMKYVRVGFGALLIVAVLGGGVYAMLPNSSRRLTETIEDVTSGQNKDIRIYISATARQAIAQNMPFGVGAGDRMHELKKSYNGPHPLDERLRGSELNPHNQFLDTLLTTGVPGFIALVLMLGLPFVGRWRKLEARGVKSTQFSGYPYLTSLIACISLTCLFESALERQMAILLFCFFYCLLLCDSGIDKEDATV